MRQPPRALAAALFLALISSVSLAGQDSAKTPSLRSRAPAERRPAGRLLGVYDAKGPLEGVEVLDLIGQASVRTSETGSASLSFLRSQHDTGIVQVRKLGYRDTTFMVMMGPADTIPITLLLDRVVLLSEVLTTANAGLPSLNMREFEAHYRTRAGGQFLSPEQLRQEDDGRPIGLVFLSHGFLFGSRGPTSVQTMGCRPITFVNGARQSPPDNPTAGMFEAIEYYKTGLTAPAGYDGNGSHCGVILYWLRERQRPGQP